VARKKEQAYYKQKETWDGKEGREKKDIHDLTGVNAEQRGAEITSLKPQVDVVDFKLLQNKGKRGNTQKQCREKR